MNTFNVLIIDPNKSFSRAAKRYLLKKMLVEKAEVECTQDGVAKLADKLQPRVYFVDYNYYLESKWVQLLCKKVKNIDSQTSIVLLPIFPDIIKSLPTSEHPLIDAFISKQDFGISASSYIEKIRS